MGSACLCYGGGGEDGEKHRLINPHFVGDIQGEKQLTVLGRTYSEVRASECTHLASRRFLFIKAIVSLPACLSSAPVLGELWRELSRGLDSLRIYLGWDNRDSHLQVLRKEGGNSNKHRYLLVLVKSHCQQQGPGGTDLVFSKPGL